MTDVAVARRAPRPVAWWGMAMLVASEATLFGVLIGTYVYLRFGSAHWPPDGIAAPAVATPLALSLGLAAGTLLLVPATRAGRAGRLAATRALVLAATAVQAGYLAWSIHDFADSLDVFAPQRDAYASIYYVLLGADHAHVAVGLLLDAWLLAKLARGLTGYRVRALRVVTFYWLAIAVLTLCVTGTILSAAA